MEAKFLASLFSFLSIFLAIYAQSLVNDADDSTPFEFETAIYYGDSNVNLGEPFSITCIIPISDRIHWLKDGDPITRHNLRHGRDDHSYMLSESAIEGEKHKIEAHLSVRHALKVHEGRYQCNPLHATHHMLHVRTPPAPNDNQASTETVYESVDELLAPSTAAGAAGVYTRSWDGGAPSVFTPSTLNHLNAQQQQHRKHHHHNHQFVQQNQHPSSERKEHKYMYTNASTFNEIRSGGVAVANTTADRAFNAVDFLPPPPQYKEVITTVPWRSTAGVGMKQPPPELPPPRLAMPSSTAMLPTFAPPHYSYTYPGLPGEYYQTANTAAVDVVRQQQQQQQHVNFPVQTMHRGYQQPPPPPPFVVTSYQQVFQPTHQTMQHGMLVPGQHQHQHQHQQLHHHHHEPNPLSPMHTSAPPAIMPKSNEADFLVPNYDNAEQRLKVYEIRSALVLSCNITKEGDYELTWEKNGTDVKKVKELEGRYRIIPAERKFIIDKTDTNDDGLYSCVADKKKAHINVVARVVVRVPSNTGVVEGEKLTIVCTVVGTEPKLSWLIGVGNQTITNSTGRFTLKPDENHVDNAILIVENASLKDRGEYKCIGRNAANEFAKYAEASDVSYVRVKDKLAALWPFLGIVAEVLILCTIILIYEKRRNKSELEESDTDPQEQKKKKRTYD